MKKPLFDPHFFLREMCKNDEEKTRIPSLKFNY